MKTLTAITTALMLSVAATIHARAATYCDFNIKTDCPPAISDVAFPLEEIKIACFKDMAPFSNEPEELKQAMLTSCIGYARTRFEITHQRRNEK